MRLNLALKMKPNHVSPNINLNSKKMRLFTLIALFFIGSASTFAQDTINFYFTGGAQQFTVPGCINGDIEIIVAGAEGGSNYYYPNNGGDGAVLQGMITVSGGDVIDMIIGGQGPCPGAGFNGGGQSFASAGSSNYDGCGGGGSTNVNINGTPTLIAAGGGGSGGGGTSSFYTPGGGAGGCSSGVTPGNSPFAQGGGGGTQTGPGNGGAPWAGVAPGGSPGIMGTGGMGGQWNTASGGGGGGGYFGGGGGGNDGCCTGANAGGGGGGGSSLWPSATVGCTQGGNTGDGYVTIILPECETTICAGDTAFIDFAPQFPAGANNFTVDPPTGVYQAAPGDANVGFLPTDSTLYTITAQTMSGPQSIQWPVHVVQQIEPDAGLDDSLCHSLTQGAQLTGTLFNDGNFYWTTDQMNTFSGGPGNVIYDPGTAVINPEVTANLPGYYSFILHEEDTTGVCPEGTDTIFVYFSEETHTTTFLDPICNGYSDGEITITSDNSAASGDLGASEYSIDGGATFQSNGTFTGLPAGTYDIVTNDYLGCTFTSQVVLTDPPLVEIFLASANDSTVCQNGTATMVAYATGGTSYSFHWTHTGDAQGYQQVSPTNPFSTTVYAENENGCISSDETINIDLHTPITVSITPNDTICPGDDASVTVTANGGFNGYNYSWTANGAPYNGTTEHIDVNPLVTTEYCVTVSDVCETTPVTICADILKGAVPNVMFTADTTEGCNPTTITFTNLTDPALSDSLTWKIGDDTYYFNSQVFTHEFDEVGTYDVYLEVYTEMGCHDDLLAEDYITVHEVPDARFYPLPNSTHMFSTDIDFVNLTEDNGYSYYWTMPGGTPSYSTDFTPHTTYPEEVANTYEVDLLVVSPFNCIDSAQAFVNVTSEVILFAPNVFTPDGDEYNETWRVYARGLDIYDFHLTVFNRWGEIVWESYDVTAEWDGTYGSKQPENQTYVWVVETKDAYTDKKYEFRGHVTVLK